MLDQAARTRLAPAPRTVAGLLLAATIAGSLPLAAASGQVALAPRDESPEETRVAEDEEPEAGKATNRLLYLSDGRVLRVRARRVRRAATESTGSADRATDESPLDARGFESGTPNDTWEIYTRGKWQALPAGLVVRAALERDKLREARALAREVNDDEPHQKLGYATWLVEQGLLAEALAELDQLLERVPEHPATLALLGSGRIRVAFPPIEDTDTFLRHAAGIGPAGAELAIAVMRDTASGQASDWEAPLTQELVADRAQRRAFAAHALRRLVPGAAVTPLLRRSIVDSSEEVRRAAGLALASADEQVIVPVVEALEHKSELVRLRAVEALGMMGFASAVPPLVAHLTNLEQGKAVAGSPRAHVFFGTQTAYLSDFDVQVAQGASIAKPRVGVLRSGDLLDARVLATTIGDRSIASRSRQKRATRQALERLTGARPGRRAADWKRWLEETPAPE